MLLENVCDSAIPFSSPRIQVAAACSWDGGCRLHRRVYGMQDAGSTSVFMGWRMQSFQVTQPLVVLSLCCLLTCLQRLLGPVQKVRVQGEWKSCHDPLEEFSQMEIGRYWRRKGDASLLDLSVLDFCPFLLPSVAQGPIIPPRISGSSVYRCATLCTGSTMRAEPRCSRAGWAQELLRPCHD